MFATRIKRRIFWPIWVLLPSCRTPRTFDTCCFPRPYEFWLDLDNQFLPFCQAVLRLPGPSSGADKEVLFAQEQNIPVFTDIDDLVKHFDSEPSPESGAG